MKQSRTSSGRSTVGDQQKFVLLLISHFISQFSFITHLGTDTFIVFSNNKTGSKPVSVLRHVVLEENKKVEIHKMRKCAKC
jgi:hypothetical protein